MISFTEAATAALLRFMTSEDDPGLFVRLRAAGSGCTGYAYSLLLDDVRRKNDRVFTTEGGLVVHVDESSALLLAGSLVDVDADGELAIVTPRPQSGCGTCGSHAHEPSESAAHH